MAAGDLCTISDFRQYSRIAPGTEDNLLKALITSASIAIANEIGRDFTNINFTETKNGTGMSVMPLDNKPITGITSLVIDGVNIPARTTPSGSGYSFSENCIYLSGYSFTRGSQNVTVVYQNALSGDDDLKVACMMLVDFWAHEHDRAGVRSRVLGPGETVIYDKSAWPKAVDSILQNHISPGLLV